MDFFPRQLTRGGYVLRFLIYLGIQIALLTLMSRFAQVSRGGGEALGVGILMMLAAVFFIAVGVLPRLRDMALSPWCVLVLLVPVVGMILAMGLLVAPTGWYTKYKEARST